MSFQYQAANHVSAHAAQTDHPYLHSCAPFARLRVAAARLPPFCRLMVYAKFRHTDVFAALWTFAHNRHAALGEGTPTYRNRKLHL
jgi:hypothetical protein